MASAIDLSSQPILINRAVIALEDDGVVARSAERRFRAPAEWIMRRDADRFDVGENMMYTINRTTWRLQPETDRPVRFDGQSMIDVVGMGSRVLDDAHQHRMSRMTPVAVADLVSTMLPEIGVARISLIGSFLDFRPAEDQGVLTSGFLFDFIRALQNIVPAARQPHVYSAELSEVGIDLNGRIRTLGDLHMADMEADPGFAVARTVLVVEPNVDGQLNYTTRLAFDDIGTPRTEPHQSSLRERPNLSNDSDFSLLHSSSSDGERPQSAGPGPSQPTPSVSFSSLAGEASSSSGSSCLSHALATNRTDCNCATIDLPIYTHSEF